ncbi:MAG: nucleoside hydrolase [Eubacteriales bacterium]|nr:nucleoside hydrolase [Eubacteriales bacterium]
MKSYPFRYAFEVPECKKVRILISTDCKNEADDQFALVHALMTPKFRIQGIIAAHFGRPDSMQLSFDEINRVLDIMDMTGAVPVLHGAEQALAADGETVLPEGAASIIREARSDDPAPLFVLAWGPLTDVALAVRQAPEIAGKVNLIWIGGAAWPQGGPEYNLHNDIAAANIVMKSVMPVQMITSPGFRRSFVSLAELEYKVLPKFMQKFDGTGVQKALDAAVFDLLDRIVVFPVEDEHKLTDGKGRVLPDAFLMKRGSTSRDLAFQVHTDIGEGFLYAIDAKTGMRIKDTQELKNGDIIKIVSVRK